MNTVRATSDGGCIVLGKTEPPDLDFRDFPFAARFDPSGRLLWFRTYAKKRGSEEYHSPWRPSPMAGSSWAGAAIRTATTCSRSAWTPGGNVMWKKGRPLAPVGAKGRAVAALADGRLGVAGYTVNRFGKQRPPPGLAGRLGTVALGPALRHRRHGLLYRRDARPGRRPHGAGHRDGIGGNGAIASLLLRVDASGQPLGFEILRSVEFGC